MGKAMVEHLERCREEISEIRERLAKMKSGDAETGSGGRDTTTEAIQCLSDSENALQRTISAIDEWVAKQ